MIDYNPTQYVTLPDGRKAIRYAEHNDTGGLLGYRYFIEAGEPDISNGPPTPIARGTLLKGATAEAFSLNADTAVPDEALSQLAYASQHVWTRLTAFDISVASHGQYGVSSQTSQTATTTIYYANEILNRSTGEFRPDTQQTITVSYATYTNTNILKGKYWSPTSLLSGAASNIYYTPTDAPDATREINGSYHNVNIYGGICSVAKISDVVETFYSINPDAYPKNTSLGGYYYAYVGKYENLPEFVSKNDLKFVAGTYTGNGAMTRTILIGFTPRVVYAYYDYMSMLFLCPGSQGILPGGFRVYYSGSGNTGSNRPSIVYNYFAIA